VCLQDYFYHGLQEFYDDGVQYMEVRTTVHPVCANLDTNDCQQLGFLESAKVLQEAADKVNLLI